MNSLVTQAAKPGILDGVRVLDFTAMMSGPYATRLMADMGAEVIKIEPPEGDHIRSRPPRRQGRSTYFAQLNCGKKSLALDLKKPAAITLVSRPCFAPRARGRATRWTCR